jgi:hypothetical protein
MTKEPAFKNDLQLPVVVVSGVDEMLQKQPLVMLKQHHSSSQRLLPKNRRCWY